MIDEQAIADLIAKLRYIAKAAPPGPWFARVSSGYGNPSVHANDGPLFSTGSSRRPKAITEAAALYVQAANPENILALLDILEVALTERRALIDGVDKLAAAAAQDWRNSLSDYEGMMRGDDA